MVTTEHRTNTPDPSPLGAAWWAWPLVVASGVYIASTVMGGMPWWAFALTGLVLTVGGAVWAWYRFDPVDYGDGVCRTAMTVAAAGGAAAAGWLGVAVLSGDPLRWLQWLLWGTAGWAAAYGLIGVMAAAAARGIRAAYAPGDRPAAATEAELEDLGDDVRPYREALDLAGLTEVAVTRVVPSPSGGVETVHLEPRPAPGKRATGYDAVAAAVPAVTTELARIMETARGLELADDAVMALRGRSAHRYQLQVSLNPHAMGDVPYYTTDQPRGPYEPFRLGRIETETDLTITFADAEQGATHMTVIMYKGGGKTVLAHNAVAEATRSDAWEIWLAATDKLVPLAYPWLAPWLEGRTDRPVIDRVAGQDQTGILQMLADALEFTALTNDTLGRDPVRQVAPGRAGLTVLLDESSGCLTNPEKIKCHDGIARNASEVWALIKQLSRSAMVSCIDLSQYGLFGQGGKDGSKSIRNGGVGVVGKVRRRSDAYAAIPNLPHNADPTKLRHHLFYVQADLDDDGGVVQRAKAARLEGDRVDEVAVRHTRWRGGLDPAITARLTYYADRWDPEMHRELVAQATADGLDWPVGTADPGPDPTTPDHPAGHPADQGADHPADHPAGPVATGGPDHPEAPVSTTPEPPADLRLPSGWTDPDADVWAMLEGRHEPPADRVLNTDVTGLLAAADRLAAEAGAHYRPARVADPLGRVLRLLNHPKAPTDYVSTADLAEELRRIPEQADEVTRRRAVERLGMELARQTGLKARRLSASIDPARPSGWAVAELRDAGERLARGGDPAG